MKVKYEINTSSNATQVVKACSAREALHELMDDITSAEMVGGADDRWIAYEVECSDGFGDTFYVRRA